MRVRRFQIFKNKILSNPNHIKNLFFYFTGAQFGTVISMPLSGVLSEYGFAGGWPSIFYVFGAIGTLWSVAFLWLVHEDPESHPTIPHDERKYIISSVWGAAGVSVSVLQLFWRAR